MRCFVSIDIPKEVQEVIKEIQNLLPVFKGKKTELQNLHLTLKFLGEVDGVILEKVKNRLKKIRFQEFTTELDYLGFFDNSKYGVVWIFIPNCEKLQKKVDDVLEGLFLKEKRFMSHLTIARVKFLQNKKQFLRKLKTIKIPKTSFKVNEFRLKKSDLASTGPFYRTLEIYKLLNEKYN